MIGETAVSGAFMGAVACAFFSWSLSRGRSELEARNLVLFLMVAFENAHVFNCRSETRSAFRTPLSNNWPVVAIAVVGAQAVQIGATFVPGLRDVLQIGADHGGDVAASGAACCVGASRIGALQNDYPGASASVRIACRSARNACSALVKPARQAQESGDVRAPDGRSGARTARRREHRPRSHEGRQIIPGRRGTKLYGQT